MTFGRRTTPQGLSPQRAAWGYKGPATRPNLRDAKIDPVVRARLSILPGGDIIGWKAASGKLVKLLIPSRAKRSNAMGRKCRASYVRVLSVVYPRSGAAAKEAASNYDPYVIYKKGKLVRCDEWNDDWTIECGGGIHFCITREEAEDWL